MDKHDIDILVLALDTAITEASMAAYETATDAPEYPGYVFAYNEFSRLKDVLNDMH